MGWYICKRMMLIVSENFISNYDMYFLFLGIGDFFFKDNISSEVLIEKFSLLVVSECLGILFEL